MKLKVLFDFDDSKDIVTYNDILTYVTESPDNPKNKVGEIFWIYRRILNHKHTPRGHYDRRNTRYEVKFEWSTGDTS